jgi:hypothetical protein
MNGTTMAPARLTSVVANTIHTDLGSPPTPRQGFLRSIHYMWWLGAQDATGRMSAGGKDHARVAPVAAMRRAAIFVERDQETYLKRRGRRDRRGRQRTKFV